MIIRLLTAVFRRRQPDRYVGRHRAPEPAAQPDDGDPLDFSVAMITDSDSPSLVRRSTPA